MAKIIVGIVGEIAAGKTTLTQYLEKKYQAVSFRFSDMLRDVLQRLYLPVDRANLQTISTILRSNFGDDIMSKVLARDVAQAQDNFIITEGIRRPSDITDLKKLDNFLVIAIQTDEQTRYQRLTQRAENPDDQGKTWEQFQADGKKEPEQKIKEIIQQADYTIDNNADREKMYEQTDNIIKKVYETGSKN